MKLKLLRVDTKVIMWSFLLVLSSQLPTLALIKEGFLCINQPLYHFFPDFCYLFSPD
ncbi:Uncharacterised protein [Streptococcus pneumoniae]|nr:Uncharacterised protein [Streptococcus pneumoniae]